MKVVISQKGSQLLAQLASPDTGPKLDADPEVIRPGGNYFGVSYDALKKAGPGTVEFNELKGSR